MTCSWYQDCQVLFYIYDICQNQTLRKSKEEESAGPEAAFVRVERKSQNNSRCQGVTHLIAVTMVRKTLLMSDIHWVSTNCASSRWGCRGFPTNSPCPFSLGLTVQLLLDLEGTRLRTVTQPWTWITSSGPIPEPCESVGAPSCCRMTWDINVRRTVSSRVELEPDPKFRKWAWKKRSTLGMICEFF